MEWKNDILSFSGFDYGVSKKNQSICDYQCESDEIDESNPSPTLHEIENLNCETALEDGGIQSQCEFDAMSERKIENFYFRNVEQAERKMKQLTVLKSKWSEPRKEGEKIMAKACLKPISQENPWKNGIIQEKEAKKNNNNRLCIIS